MKTLNLQKLFHALVVAEESSLVAASRKLHLTQSALTRSIKSLEDELDIAIFHRKSTGVSLTSEGEVIIARARALLEQAGELRAEARSLSSGSQSVASFGLDPMIAGPLLASQLPGMITQSRLMQIQVKVESRASLLGMLLDKAIDFFIADTTEFKPAEIQNIHIDPLRQLRGSFFVRPGHPLATGLNITRKAIYAYPIITPSNVHEAIWEELRWHHMDANEPERRQQVICPDIPLLKTVTAQSDAVFACPDFAVSEDCTSGRLVRIDHRVANNEDIRTLGLVTHKDTNLSVHSKDIMAAFSTAVHAL